MSSHYCDFEVSSTTGPVVGKKDRKPSVLLLRSNLSKMLRTFGNILFVDFEKAAHEILYN